MVRPPAGGCKPALVNMRTLFLFIALLIPFATVAQTRFVRAVNNIAELTSSSNNPEQIHTNIFVANYSTDGDGGGGYFSWYKGATNAPDGGKIFASNYAGANGRFKRQFEEPVDVRWYGARTDGVTDDTVAVLAAYTGLPTTGGAIYIPRKCKFNLVIAKSNVTLIGDGAIKDFTFPVPTAYWTPANTNNPVVQISNDSGLVKGFYAHDFTMYAPSAAIGMSFVGGAFEASCTHFAIWNFTTCIKIKDGTNPLSLLTFDDFQIQSAPVANSRGIYALDAVGGSYVTALHFISGHIDGNSATNSYVFEFDSTYDNQIAHSYIDAIAEHCGFLGVTGGSLPIVNMTDVVLDIGGSTNSAITLGNNFAFPWNQLQGTVKTSGSFKLANGTYWPIANVQYITPLFYAPSIYSGIYFARPTNVVTGGEYIVTQNSGEMDISSAGSLAISPKNHQTTLVASHLNFDLDFGIYSGSESVLYRDSAGTTFLGGTTDGILLLQALGANGTVSLAANGIVRAFADLNGFSVPNLIADKVVFADTNGLLKSVNIGANLTYNGNTLDSIPGGGGATNAIIAINGLTNQSQFITLGSTGSVPSVVSSIDTHKINLPNATNSASGILTSNDYVRFNNKTTLIPNTNQFTLTSSTNLNLAKGMIVTNINNTGWYHSDLSNVVSGTSATYSFTNAASTMYIVATNNFTLTLADAPITGVQVGEIVFVGNGTNTLTWAGLPFTVEGGTLSNPPRSGRTRYILQQFDSTINLFVDQPVLGEELPIDAGANIIITTNNNRLTIAGSATPIGSSTTANFYRGDNVFTNSLLQSSADNLGPILRFQKQGRAGSITNTPAIFSILGRLDFNGWYGTDYPNSASILATASENFTPTALGSQIDFLTTANGATTPTTRLTIANTGKINVPQLTHNMHVGVDGSGNLVSTNGGAFITGAGVTNIAGVVSGNYSPGSNVTLTTNANGNVSISSAFSAGPSSLLSYESRGTGSDFNYTLGVDTYEKIVFGTSGPSFTITNAGMYQVVLNLSCYDNGTANQNFYVTNVTDHVLVPGTQKGTLVSSSASILPITWSTLPITFQITTTAVNKQFELWGKTQNGTYATAGLQASNTVLDVIQLAGGTFLLVDDGGSVPTYLLYDL